jgi:[ribosomal protein S18]-alanine N-acetyltransferase
VTGSAAGQGPAVSLREMTIADLDVILALELEAFGEEAWSRPMLEGELAQQPASRHYLVAQAGPRVVGYAGLLAAGNQADVVTIAVSQDQQGRGHGSALLAALLAEARRRRCTEVFLEVRVDNARAQRLYRTRGFEEVGIRRGYYQPSGADALVMRLDLLGGPDAGAPGPGSSGDRRPGDQYRTGGA